MSCEKVREGFSEYLDDALPPGQRAALERHVAQCPECRHELDVWRRTVRAVSGLPRSRAPEGFAARLMQRVRAEPVRPAGVLRIVALWPRLASVAAMFVAVALITFYIPRNGLFEALGRGGPPMAREMLRAEEAAPAHAPGPAAAQAAAAERPPEAITEAFEKGTVGKPLAERGGAAVLLELDARNGKRLEAAASRALDKSGEWDEMVSAGPEREGARPKKDRVGEKLLDRGVPLSDVYALESAPTGRGAEGEKTEGSRAWKQDARVAFDNGQRASQPAAPVEEKAGADPKALSYRSRLKKALGLPEGAEGAELVVFTDEPFQTAVEIARIAGQNGIRDVAVTFREPAKDLYVTVEGPEDACARFLGDLSALEPSGMPGPGLPAEARGYAGAVSLGVEVAQELPSVPSGEADDGPVGAKPDLPRQQELRPAVERRGGALREQLQWEEAEDVAAFAARGLRSPQRFAGIGGGTPQRVKLVIRLVRRRPVRPPPADPTEAQQEPGAQPAE